MAFCISFQWRISAALVVYNFADNEGILNSSGKISYEILSGL